MLFGSVTPEKEMISARADGTAESNIHIYIYVKTYIQQFRTF